DDAALEEYSISSGLQNAVLEQFDGAQRAANDLRALVDRCRQWRHWAAPLVRKIGHVDVVEQAVIAGLFQPGLIDDGAAAAAVAQGVASRLDALLGPDEERWTPGVVDGEGVSFARTVRGVQQ
ncbi:hypothetical protein, partial [Leclercia adecarboxylata]|uniref:hypothetical protein n=1 Tax=Leclercia adecarboxylata TaxID=83655 RepID=UPI00234D5EA1